MRPGDRCAARQHAGIAALIALAEQQASSRDTAAHRIPPDPGPCCADQMARWDAETAGSDPAGNDRRAMKPWKFPGLRRVPGVPLPAAAAVAVSVLALTGGGAALAANVTPPPATQPGACVKNDTAAATTARWWLRMPLPAHCPAGWSWWPYGMDPSGGTSGTQGPAGPAGPAGPKGDTGAAGSPGLGNVQADEPYGQDVDPNAGITQSDGAIAAGTTGVVWAACPAGKAAIGGGFRIGNGQSADAAESDSTAATYSGSDVQVLASESSYYDAKTGKLSLAAAPQVTAYGSYLPDAWAVTVHNSGTATAYARANVICATVAS